MLAFHSHFSEGGSVVWFIWPLSTSQKEKKKEKSQDETRSSSTTLQFHNLKKTNKNHPCGPAMPFTQIYHWTKLQVSQTWVVCCHACSQKKGWEGLKSLKQVETHLYLICCFLIRLRWLVNFSHPRNVNWEILPSNHHKTISSKTVLCYDFFHFRFPGSLTRYGQVLTW